MQVFRYYLIISFMVFSINAQEISGKWNGLLKVQGMQLRLVFNISNSNKPYTIDDITVYALEDGRVDVTTTIVAYIWIPDICK